MTADNPPEAVHEVIDSPTQDIPRPEPLGHKSMLRRWIAPDERSQLERDASQSHNIKRFATYSALTAALLLYGVGIYVVLGIVGFLPNRPALSGEQWHIATLAVLALFSVPTMLLLAVLRRTDKTEKSSIADTLPHEWLGQKVSTLLDKLIDKI